MRLFFQFLSLGVQEQDTFGRCSTCLREMQQEGEKRRERKTKERHDDHSEKRWMISILDAALLLHLVRL